MQKPYHIKFGMRQKIILFFFCLAAITALTGLSLGYLWGSRIIKNSIGTDYLKLAQLISASIDQMIGAEVNKLESYVTSPFWVSAINESNLKYQSTPQKNIQQYLVDMDKRWIPASLDDPLIKEYLNSLMSERLRALEAADKSIREIFITDKYGGLVASSGKTTDFYQADEAWWQSAFAAGKGKEYIGDISWDESSNSLSIVFAVPIRDQDNQVIGVCKAAADVERFFQPLENFQLGKKADVNIINEKGEFIFYRGARPLSMKLSAAEELDRLLRLDNKWAILSGFGPDKQNQLIALSQVKYPVLSDGGIFWYALVRQDVGNVFAPLRVLIFRLLLILLVVSAMLLFLGFIFAGIFIRPIRKFQEGIGHIARGDLDYRLQIKTGDEIEQLAVSFNQMAGDLKKSMTSIDNLNQEIFRRRVVENNLAEEKERLSVTLFSIGDGVIVTDTQGRVTLINKAAQQLTGWQSKDALNKRLEDVFNIVHEKTRQRCENPVVKVIKTGKVAELGNHTVLISSDGTERIVDDTAAPIYDQEKKMLGVILVFRDVTRSHRLQDAAQRLAAIIESSEDAIIGKDLQGTILTWNKGAEKMYGHASVEIVGKHVSLLIPREKHIEIEQFLTTVKKGQTVQHFETVRIRKDGTLIDVSVTISPIKDDEGNIIGASTISRDITKEKIAAESLKKAYQTNRAILEKAPFGIFVINENGGVDYVNPAMLKISGDTYEQFKKINMLELETYKEKGLDKKIRAVFSGQSFFMPDVEYISYIGKKPSVRNITGLPFDEEGKNKALIFMEDITRQKKIETEIRRANQEWQRTFDSMSDLIFIQDKDSNIIRANKAFIDAIKMEPKDIIGKPCYQVVHKSGKPWLNCPYQKTKLDKSVHTEEVFDKNIGIPLLITTSPVIDDNGELLGAVHIARDVSEIKKAREELENKNKELSRLDRLKSEFISTVSHELRTPLSITKEGISLVLDRIPGPINEKQDKILQTSRNNIDRLARIINDLLDISKIEAGRIDVRRESVNINDLIHSIVSLFQFKARDKGLELKFDLPGQGVNIYVDRDRITEVFTNLLDNAIKFTQKGAIKVSVQEGENGIICCVEDSGIGITKDDLPKIFEKFQQFSRLPGSGDKGTGLGLTIAKAIVELHKGRIWVESQEGKGTKFIFSLPKYNYMALVKEQIDLGVKDARENRSSFALIAATIEGFEGLKHQINSDSLRLILNGLEGIIHNNLRKAGDNTLKDAGEFIVFLRDCNKEQSFRMEERLNEVMKSYLAAQGYSDKIHFKFNSMIYPDEVRSVQELIGRVQRHLV